MKTAKISVPVDELQKLLNRALNTWEPAQAPAWAFILSDAVKEGDEVEVTIRRADVPASPN